MKNNEIYLNMLIGITGGIGSGKSSVAKLLEKWGYAVYNSDDWAKYLVENLPIIIKEITNEFGEKAYENHTYQRQYIANIVFHQPEKLSKLNSIIHPHVAKHFEDWKLSQPGKIIFKETALLFELDLDKKCDKSLLVTADIEKRIERVMQRDGKTKEQILAIISKQMPESDKIKRADYIITNNTHLDDLEMETRLFVDKIEK